MQNLLLQLFQIKEQKIKLIKLDKDEIQKSIANKSYYYVFGYSKASNTWSVNYRALYNLLPCYKGGNIKNVGLVDSCSAPPPFNCLLKSCESIKY